MFRSFEGNSSNNSNSEGASLDWIEQSIQEIADELEYAPGQTPSKNEKPTVESIKSTDTEDIQKLVSAQSRQELQLPSTPRNTSPHATCNFRTRSGQFKEYEISIVNDEVVFLRPQSSNVTRIAYKIDSFQCLKSFAI